MQIPINSVELELDGLCNPCGTAEHLSNIRFDEICERISGIGLRKIILIGPHSIPRERLHAFIRDFASKNIDIQLTTDGRELDGNTLALCRECNSSIMLVDEKYVTAAELVANGFPAANVWIAMHLTQQNIAGIRACHDYYRSLGVNVRLYVKGLIDSEQLHSIDDILYSCRALQESVLVDGNGDVFPCGGIRIRAGNLFETPFPLILNEIDMLCDLRSPHEMYKEPCHSCPQVGSCHSCRGNIFALLKDYLSADPLCWRNKDKLAEIKSIPRPAAELMPHKPPMAMVDTIESAGVNYVTSLTIKPDNRFLNGDGVLDRSVIPELVAQSAAALDALRFDGRVNPGFLAIGHDIKYFSDAHSGDTLYLDLSYENTMEKWFLIKFSISTKSGRLLSTGEVSVCQI